MPVWLRLSINLWEDLLSASVDLIHHTVLGTLYQFILVPVFVLHGQNLHGITRLQHFVHCVPWPSLYIYTLFSTAVTKIWLTRWCQLCKPASESGKCTARFRWCRPGLAQNSVVPVEVAWIIHQNSTSEEREQQETMPFHTSKHKYKVSHVSSSCCCLDGI